MQILPSVHSLYFHIFQNKWEGYNDTLSTQISKSQTKIQNQTLNVQHYTLKHFSLIKLALESHITESRGYDLYLREMFAYLNTFYENVTQASEDYPELSSCTNAAREQLDIVVNAGEIGFIHNNSKITTRNPL